MNEDRKIRDFIEKVKKLEKGEKLDLSSDEDLSVGIMNLISIEEHLFFSASKTGNDEYFDLLNEVREMRKSLLKRLIKDYKGEDWCISKHLLAASMRLMEVGTKFLTKGDKAEAKDFFKKAYQLYSLFWSLNLGFLKVRDVGGGEIKKISLLDEGEKPKAETVGLFEKLGSIVQKIIDCCRE